MVFPAPGEPSSKKTCPRVKPPAPGDAPLSSSALGGDTIDAGSIDGGTEHRLAEGDVLVVPAGVPHQFVDVSDPFLYFVAKVES